MDIELLCKANDIQNKLKAYTQTKTQTYFGILQIGSIDNFIDLSDDKELVLLIRNHCKKRIEELRKQFEEL